MRLGGPVFGDWNGDVDAWAGLVRQHGYGAAICPLKPGASDDDCRRVEAAAAKADVVIAEVGAWTNNPISPDESIRKTSIEKTIACLDLAERVGARVCVNVAGSRGEVWAGPHPDNVRQVAFDAIVESVRTIVDAVRPKRAVYTLEAMPYTLPDSPESYLKLMAAIDRPTMTAVHFDPVNMIHTARLAYDTASFIRHCLRLLGPYIRSVHAKDVALRPAAVTHIDEVVPGEGVLDYGALLRGLEALDDADLPVIIEHLPDAATYARAADHIRGVAAANGLAFR